MRTLVLLLSAMLAGCSGDTSDKTGTPGDDDDDDDDTDVIVETADTGGGGPTSGMNPVAVGFELIATIETDGSLGPYDYGDGYLNPPRVVMTFADEAFFDPSVTDQTGHYCVVVGFMTDPYDLTATIPPLVKPDQIETRSFGLKEGKPDAGIDNALVFESYDMTILAIAETVDNPCAGLVDSELWGEDASGLLTPFVGAHLGWGFGQMTDYLVDYFLDEGKTTSEFLTDYGDAMMAGYVAINNKDGEFLAYDWTTSILFQNDPDTNLVLADPTDDTLLALPIDAPVGGELPEGYIQSYAYWYQDFVRMDLTNLTDGAPTY